MLLASPCKKKKNMQKTNKQSTTGPRRLTPSQPICASEILRRHLFFWLHGLQVLQPASEESAPFRTWKNYKPPNLNQKANKTHLLLRWTSEYKKLFPTVDLQCTVLHRFNQTHVHWHCHSTIGRTPPVEPARLSLPILQSLWRTSGWDGLDVHATCMQRRSLFFWGRELLTLTSAMGGVVNNCSVNGGCFLFGLTCVPFVFLRLSFSACCILFLISSSSTTGFVYYHILQPFSLSQLETSKARFQGSKNCSILPFYKSLAWSSQKPKK